MERHPEQSQKCSSEVTLNINGYKSHLFGLMRALTRHTAYTDNTRTVLAPLIVVYL
jgi:hypothetical protein